MRQELFDSSEMPHEMLLNQTNSQQPRQRLIVHGVLSTVLTFRNGIVGSMFVRRS
jgi:hypothetical protein